MLTGEVSVEINALGKQGWTVSAIARHVGHDRKTVRRYLTGEVEAGVRVRSAEDPFDRFEPYVRQRLIDDPHLWATVLFAEVQALGWSGAYTTFTQKLRQRELRPHCEPCAGVKGRATVEIEHPPGVETQWDWLELSDTPWGKKAFVLVGALSHSAKFRAWFSESDDQAHLVVGLDAVSRRLGGLTREWRVDRMATVINPTSGRLQSSFVPVARHYGVKVVPCPPRRGNRKGVVEKSIHYLTQGWWRTARVFTPAQAQLAVDRWCEQVADQRLRDVEEAGEGPRLTVAAMAAREPLSPLPPSPYPIEVELLRQVAANGLVSVWGNRYSVPPAVIGAEITVRWRHGTEKIDFLSPAGSLVATHRLAPPGANRTVRLPEHTQALENVVLAQFSTARPCQSKENRPPSDSALALAREIGGGAEPVIDLDRYQRLINGEKP